MEGEKKRKKPEVGEADSGGKRRKKEAVTSPPPTEEEVEEFFTILRRMRVAAKYFENNSSGNIKGDIHNKLTAAVPEPVGVVKLGNHGVLLDLNSVPDDEINSD